MALNKVMIIGNLGADPVLKYTPSHAAVLSLRVAVTESYTSRTGERVKNTEWFNVIAWNKLAETAAQFLHKGSKLYVEGKLTTREFQNSQGVTLRAIEVIASSIQFLDPFDTGKQKLAQPAPGPALPAVSENDFFGNDDIPF